MIISKKIRTKTALGMAAAHSARVEVAAPTAPEMPRNDVGGKLPGDETVDMYWENRVAAWLGVSRKRVSTLRRRSMNEGDEWIVYRQQVVYTLKGIQALRDRLLSLGLVTLDGSPKVATPAAPEAPRVPAGPPERAKAKITRIYPNVRLMAAQIIAQDGAHAPRQITVKVRENTNFMPGMQVEVVYDAAAASWQFTGRLPRSRGRW
jgi:hypothetical protein